MTVLFCDTVGSTALQSAIGDDSADEIRRRLFALLRSAVARYKGETIKTLGDGVMAVFSESIADALRCAIEMTRAAPGVAEGLAVRVGVSHGEVSSEGGDWFGTPVVEASRLESAAESGTVLAAQVVQAIVGSRGGFLFAELPSLDLKGFPGPVRVVRVSDAKAVPRLGEPPRFARDAVSRPTTRSRSLPSRGYVLAIGLAAIVLLAGGLAALFVVRGSHSSSLSPADVGYTPKYEAIQCPSDTGGAGVTCGNLIVPQDRTHPKGRQIRLLIVRAAAETPHPSADPVLYLAGFNGEVGTGTTTNGRLYSNYIGMSLRGSQGAEPELNCPETVAPVVAALAFPPLSPQGVQEQLTALGRCRAAPSGRWDRPKRLRCRRHGRRRPRPGSSAACHAGESHGRRVWFARGVRRHASVSADCPQRLSTRSGSAWP